MATVNFIYRSLKKNEDLEIRLTFRLHAGEYKTIIAKSGIKVFNNEEYPKNPFNESASYKEKANPYKIYQSLVELSGKNFFELAMKTKSVFPDFTDIDKRNGLTDILAKVSEVDGLLSKLSNYILSEVDKTDPEHLSKKWLEAKIGYFHNPNKGRPKVSAPETLMEYFDYYIKGNNTIKYGTSKKFTTIKSKLLKRLDQFEYGRPILMNDIDDYFREQYESIFSDYSSNTVNRDLAEIKTLCKHAETKGVEIHRDVFRWKIKIGKTPIIYLTPEEIQLITDLIDLPEYLDNARDWLLISCYTGQRISDFKRFDKSMISYDLNSLGVKFPYLEFIQVKTGKPATVAFPPEMTKVLKKRKGGFPRAISDQKYNNYIKEVSRLAGLTDEVYGGKINTETKRKEFACFPKWQLVSSHIGRRSFATNNYGKIPTPILMAATGHTTEDKFLIYIGKTRKEKAKELANYYYQ